MILFHFVLLYGVAGSEAKAGHRDVSEIQHTTQNVPISHLLASC